MPSWTRFAMQSDASNSAKRFAQAQFDKKKIRAVNRMSSSSQEKKPFPIALCSHILHEFPMLESRRFLICVAKDRNVQAAVSTERGVANK
jgi:hypothetical protein